MNKYSFNLKRNIGKTFGSLILLSSLMFSLTAFAQENVISSVTISKAHDRNDGYELNVDSTDLVSYKSVDYENGIYFDLKNSKLSEDIGTIYDDVTDIENVTVKQISKNKVRIYVQGQNAQNTDLIFSGIDKQMPSKNQIVLNRPMQEYKQIHQQDIDDEDFQDFDDMSFNLVHLLNVLKNGNFGIVLIILTVLALFAWIIKALAIKIGQDEEPLIGLNKPKTSDIKLNLTEAQQLYYTPRTNPNAFKPKSQIQSVEDLKSVKDKNETLKYAQQQLAQAHEKYRNYVIKKYGQDALNPKKLQVPDLINKSVALNQYQKSTTNPYKNQNVIKINQPQNNMSDVKTTPKNNIRKEINNAPYIKRPNRTLNSNMSQQKTPSMKFLESVSKIYAESGRGDLADELKNSMNKTKQKTSL